jgi:putative ABC transport system permease protein
MAIRDRVERGETPEESEAAALREFGNRTLVKEVTREMWGFTSAETVVQDLRYGLRTLRKNPGFTAVAVLTLALGVGANSAIFSVVNAVVLRPLPYREPDRLVTVWESSARSELSRIIVSPANYLDWREQSRAFEELGAYTEDFSNISEDASYPERVSAARATPSLFQTLGAAAIHGRSFLPEEGRPGGERVVLLGYGLWQRRFGGDPLVVGRSIKVNGGDTTVVGVLPRDFIISPKRYDLYTPLSFNDQQSVNRRARYLTVIARLRPGVTVEQSRSEMKALGGRLAEQYPDENAGRSATVFPLDRSITGGSSRTALLILLGAVSFTLLIACVNVANLLLGRAAARRREMAVRAALGAGRLRLARQLLTESVMLSLAGGLLGLFFAKWGLGLLVSLSPADIPRIDQAGLDPLVLGFTLLISTLTGLAFGLVPALQASKVDLSDGLKEGAKSTAGTRQSLIRSALVVTEVALSLVLIVGAGLLAKSFIRLSEVELGFDPDNVIAADITLPYGSYDSPARRAEFFRRLVTRVEGLPGVSSVAVSQSVPLSGEEHGTQFTVGGRKSAPDGVKFGAMRHRVSAQYLNVMGIRLLKGRGLTEHDTASAPGVVLINEALARRCFLGEDPIGKQIILDEARPREIVGVVADLRYVSPDKEPFPEIYLSYLDDPYHHMSLTVRASGDPTTLVDGIRAELSAADKTVPLANVKTMEQYVADSLGRQRFSALLLMVFAGAAMALAAMGVYGVISSSVTQRTREIGIRVALGARPADVLRLVVGRGVALVGAGIVLGLAGALALTRLMSSLLYGVSATDPATFFGITLLLTAVALLACYIPARRATKVDPMIALRYE